MGWLMVLEKIIGGMSPEVRQELKTCLEKMTEKAKATKLPFDDIGVMLLRALLGL